MTVDEALRDLLSVSTDIRRVAVLSLDGELLGSGPEAVGADVGAPAQRLWKAAARRAGEAPLCHVVVQDAGAGLAVVEAEGRRIAALTGPHPAVGLLLFDLRMCLADAFGEAAAAPFVKASGTGEAQ